MIIVRSPLRITLGGGGTDLPSFYSQFGGFCVSSAITKYVYISVNKAFGKENIIHYSHIERVDDLKDIQHPIIRECVRLVPPCESGIEITSMADVPAGTGLGSSGAFTVALLKALHTFNGDHISTHDLAEQACHIEMNILREPVGKQDAYASAYGGINAFDIDIDGNVVVHKLDLDPFVRNRLEDNLHLYYTGSTRSASKILEYQNESTKGGDRQVVNNLLDTFTNGVESYRALENGGLIEFSKLLNQQWDLKEKRDIATTNERINQERQRMLNAGALGVKLVGAGGGGFLMAYWPGAGDGVDYELEESELRFRFDYEGEKVMTL